MLDLVFFCGATIRTIIPNHLVNTPSTLRQMRLLPLPNSSNDQAPKSSLKQIKSSFRKVFKPQHVFDIESSVSQDKGRLRRLKELSISCEQIQKRGVRE